MTKKGRLEKLERKKPASNQAEVLALMRELAGLPEGTMQECTIACLKKKYAPDEEITADDDSR